MPRPEKVQAVADIRERIEGAQAVFLAEYAGLSVQEQQALRRDLRANGAEFKVVKMTLARLAAADLDIEDLDDLLLGPTGLTFADGDPVGAAKVLRDFAKTHEVLVIKGGLLGRDFLTPERIAELADIEPREVLLAKIAGAFEAPMAMMAGLLAALPRNAATAMQQLLEKKQSESPELPATSDQPEDESPTAEATAEPEPEDESPTVEEAPEADGVPEPEEAEETPEAAPETDEAPEPELEAQSSEPKAEPTESDDDVMAAEASDEDAGSESKDTDSAADDAAKEE
ncbi:MAG: 50S ribosomal protein L10 [Actinomycetota bacterium]|nr:50S ribosomal protein L10 [Actinomycetota bacterium]